MNNFYKKNLLVKKLLFIKKNKMHPNFPSLSFSFPSLTLPNE